MENFRIGTKVNINGNYIFIDTETANRNHDICQIGALIITNGTVENIVNLLVKPIECFETKNIRKNKILPTMVASQDTFDTVWKKYFAKHVNNHTLVAHNASFDLTAIGKTLNYYGIDFSPVPYICTQQLANRLNVPYESREALCKHFGLCIESSHDALSDAKDCYNIFKKLCAKIKGEVSDFTAIYTTTTYTREKIPEDLFLERELSKFSTREVNKEPVNIEQDLDFKNQQITITGSFEKYPRPEREKLAIELRKRGAKVLSSGSLAKSTTMLIAGTDAGSKKLKQAEERKIKIIDENTLYKMLEDNNAIE